MIRRSDLDPALAELRSALEGMQRAAERYATAPCKAPAPVEVESTVEGGDAAPPRIDTSPVETVDAVHPQPASNDLSSQAVTPDSPTPSEQRRGDPEETQREPDARAADLGIVSAFKSWVRRWWFR